MIAHIVYVSRLWWLWVIDILWCFSTPNVWNLSLYKEAPSPAIWYVILHTSAVSNSEYCSDSTSKPVTRSESKCIQIGTELNQNWGVFRLFTSKFCSPRYPLQNIFTTYMKNIHIFVLFVVNLDETWPRLVPVVCICWLPWWDLWKLKSTVELADFSPKKIRLTINWSNLGLF